MKTENKHNKILSAAIKVFAKKGFFSSRISDIAKEAKVADGTIYLYFNNKNDILVSILEEEIGKITANTAKRTAKTEEPLEMLRILITEHLLAMKRNRNLAEIIHTELRQAGKTIREYQTNCFAEYEGILSGIIKRGQEGGVFRTDLNPDIVRRIILGALSELSQVWTTNYETHYSAEELTSQLFTLVFAGIQKIEVKGEKKTEERESQL